MRKETEGRATFLQTLQQSQGRPPPPPPPPRTVLESSLFLFCIMILHDLHAPLLHYDADFFSPFFSRVLTKGPRPCSGAASLYVWLSAQASEGDS